MDSIVASFFNELEQDTSELAQQIRWFLSNYHPHPLRSELHKYGALINGRPILGKGIHSTVYDSGDISLGMSCATKTPLTRKSNVNELILHMVVINRMLLQGVGMGHLVPTYGYFFCEAQQGSKGQQMAVPHPIHPKLMDGFPHLVMVNQRIKGVPLHHYLITESVSLPTLKGYIIQILTLLMWLEASPYRFYHNDLHDQNILICHGRAYLIDMDFAECTIGDTRTQLSPSKRTYCGSKEAAGQLYSGAYDVYLLLSKVVYAKEKTVSEWALQSLSWFWSQLVLNKHRATWYQTLPPRYKDPWLYSILTQMENRLLEPVRSDVHQYNMDILATMTYEYLARKLLPDAVYWDQVKQEILEFEWN